MDCILHIGTEKTGTTSLQGWLDSNSAEIQDQGVFYSRALGRPNNRRLSFYGLEPGSNDDGLADIGVTDRASHEQLQALIASQLGAEIEEAQALGCRTFFISNEHCQSRLISQRSVNRVRDLLAPKFSKILVYAFMRPQVDMGVSLASTMARVGLEVSRARIEQQLTVPSAYYDLRAMLQRWAAAFGHDAIKLVSFAKERDTIAFFRRLLDLSDEKLRYDRPANEGLDYRAIAIANAIRPRSAPNGIEPVFNPQSVYFLNDLPLQERLTIDRETARRLQSRFDQDNAAICTLWPALEPAALTPDFESYPVVGNIDRLLSVNDFSLHLRAIVDRFNAELALEQARRLRAESERDEALGRLPSSIILCERAIEASARAVSVATLKPMAERFVEAMAKRLERMRQLGSRGAAPAPQRVAQKV